MIWRTSHVCILMSPSSGNIFPFRILNSICAYACDFHVGSVGIMSHSGTRFPSQLLFTRCYFATLILCCVSVARPHVACIGLPLAFYAAINSIMFFKLPKSVAVCSFPFLRRRCRCRKSVANDSIHSTHNKFDKM